MNQKIGIISPLRPIRKKDFEMKRGIKATPNPITPNKPLLFEKKRCHGCNVCVDICPMDIMIPNPKKGNPPIILFPEECWYCGSCVLHCPRKGAIELNLPLIQRVRWKRKETGEHFRV
jgi:NAD-dependent dihydropyrimidine dehydrogenase PreA subunit